MTYFIGVHLSWFLTAYFWKMTLCHISGRTHDQKLIYKINPWNNSQGHPRMFCGVLFSHISNDSGYISTGYLVSESNTLFQTIQELDQTSLFGCKNSFDISDSFFAISFGTRFCVLCDAFILNTVSTLGMSRIQQKYQTKSILFPVMFSIPTISFHQIFHQSMWEGETLQP